MPRVPRVRMPEDAGFRATTRVRAVGYGLREQSWKLTRRWDRFEERARGFWSARSPGTRARIVAIAGVFLAYALIKFAALPGIPCQVSATKECTPVDATLERIPANALAYAHLTLDDDVAQFDRAADVLGRIDRFPQLAQAGLDVLRPPSGAQVTYADDVRPWAGDDAAVAIVPGPAGANATGVMISIDDRAGAEALVAKVAPGPGTTGKENDVDLTTYDNGFATAVDGEVLVLGDADAVRTLIAAGAEGVKTLDEDPTADAAREQLPENRFADVYVSADGVAKLLTPNASAASTQLETFVDYGATRGFAAGLIARDEGIELDLVSLLDAKKEETSPSFFTPLVEFRPTLAEDVGSRALGYIGVGDAGQGLAGVLDRASNVDAGLAKSLSDFSTRLDAEAKVDPGRDLLPALRGEAALVAEPTDGIPFASLIAEEVEEERARTALAKLQGPLLRSINPQSGQPLPGFTTTSIAGADAHQLQVSPLVNLTYSLFDSKLVVSTQPAGVEQVKAGGEERLADSEAFEQATRPLGDSLSALVFLNLDELLDLAEALGRVEDPLYASFRDDIRKLHALALGVEAGDHELHTQLFVTID